MREIVVVAHLSLPEGEVPEEAFPHRHAVLDTIPATAYAAEDCLDLSYSTLLPEDEIWARLPDDMQPDDRVEAWKYWAAHDWDDATISRVGTAIVAASERYRRRLAFGSKRHILLWLPRFVIPSPLGGTED